VKITRIGIINFRELANLTFKGKPKSNPVVGLNGVGKMSKVAFLQHRGSEARNTALNLGFSPQLETILQQNLTTDLDTPTTIRLVI
jgi:recombinational DNA repair ATPase RecF